METVNKKQEQEVVLKYPSSSLSETDEVTFKILGQNPERSYEDRDVYFSMKSECVDPEAVVHRPEAEITMHLRAEDAMEIGMKLIEQGKFALEANMIQHQCIHMERNFRKFIEEDRVEEVIFKVIDDNPVNYGSGFQTYQIVPIFKEGMAPEYQEDFSYERVVHWSPFDKEFQDQLDYFTGGAAYTFIGYDHDLAVQLFKLAVRMME